MASRKPRLGLALGSGAARGWAHIGIIRGLERMGITPDLVAGCSIGSFVGAAYAAGELDKLEEWVRGFTRLQVVGLLDPAFSGGLFRGDKVFGIAASQLAQSQLEDLPIPFACIATELDTGREIWLKRGALRQAVRASCGMPGLLTPTQLDGRWLVDGAVVNPVPISLARAMGAEVVIAVNLNADTHQPWADEPDGGRSLNPLIQWFNRGEQVPTPGMWSVMSGSINIMQERITRARMAGDPPEIQLTPRLGAFSILDFHRAADAIEEGEACIERQRPQLEEELSRLGII
ncbi:patatin-like phospholipase family protein [Aeromonas simiae]|uniref:patatin-like phospholipase family protein n=1 Tax=Aeromonas simiae TaxID=218936 RepID=UPI00266BD231|nr:patatin-like phospholipase family protein [Aeromonas simiae]MDO2946907.1 patatin-like phospholipase family protein [Aeromonas simiae]MDO2950519.1 patatin-like phospholipase family protein [Aeromonas simiae]MDO2954499.1 patatin-like phospholipase family protein [Aeromonas simiae]